MVDHLPAQYSASAAGDQPLSFNKLMSAPSSKAHNIMRNFPNPAAECNNGLPQLWMCALIFPAKGGCWKRFFISSSMSYFTKSSIGESRPKSSGAPAGWHRQQVIHRRDELADRSKRSGSSIISLAAFASSDPLRSHNDVGFSGQLEAVWPGTHPMVLNLHLDGFSSPRSFGVLA